MAAEVLAVGGHAVVVVDRMRTPGRKFTLAGRGGLNLTHSESPDVFLARYEPSDKKLDEAIRAFPPSSLRAWAAELGEGTFVGTSGRVFPDSFGAIPLLRSWLDRLARQGVTFERELEWTGWEGRTGSQRLRHHFTHARTAVVSEMAPHVTVVALGGASWPGTGSTGSWVEAFRAHDVAVSDLQPSNCGYRVSWSDHFRSKNAGKPLKNVALTVGGVRRRGEIMITDSGVEGGLVYASGAALRAAIRNGTGIETELDLRADVSVKTLAKSLSSPRGSQSMSTWLQRRAHLSTVGVAVLREFFPDLPSEPGELARAIKQVPLYLDGPVDMERAISTAGGIAFEELNERFMLNRAPGLFVAGEMLNWDAPTGGYLLQASLSTGHAAGQGAVEWLSTITDPKMAGTNVHVLETSVPRKKITEV